MQSVKLRSVLISSCVCFYQYCVYHDDGDDNDDGLSSSFFIGLSFFLCFSSFFLSFFLFFSLRDPVEKQHTIKLSSISQ